MKHRFQERADWIWAAVVVAIIATVNLLAGCGKWNPYYERNQWIEKKRDQCIELAQNPDVSERKFHALCGAPTAWGGKHQFLPDGTQTIKEIEND